MADGNLEGYRRSLVAGELVEVSIFDEIIRLKINTDVGVGGRLWNASLVLLQYLQETYTKESFKVRNQHMLHFFVLRS